MKSSDILLFGNDDGFGNKYPIISKIPLNRLFKKLIKLSVGLFFTNLFYKIISN